MRQKSNATPASSETLVRNIRRATRKHHAAEEKIRIVLDGLHGETSIAELCRREGIAESMYYSWSKEFLEAGKRRLAFSIGQVDHGPTRNKHRSYWPSAAADLVSHSNPPWSATTAPTTATINKVQPTRMIVTSRSSARRSSCSLIDRQPAKPIQQGDHPRLPGQQLRFRRS
jgi:transposase